MTAASEMSSGSCTMQKTPKPKISIHSMVKVENQNCYLIVTNQDQFPLILFVAESDGRSTTLDWNVVSKMSAESNRHVYYCVC
jgi:hypothetical protein